MKKTRHSAEDYIQGIINGDKKWLSKSISVVESKKQSDIELAHQILKSLLEISSSNSIRIGITGSPGVGKSTFIEAFGRYLLDQGIRVAVLAIDPSSSTAGGSILGDKTRMEHLSKMENAYIRPSPSKATLGGISAYTRENIMLCEAAGFEVIIVETVGVGQSETLVKGLVDFFLMLVQPGAGDQLQGIKRGIMEMADGIVINKADGELLSKAKMSRSDYINALHIAVNEKSDWTPQVLLCSSLKSEGLEEVWSMLKSYRDLKLKNGSWEENRKSQKVTNFHEQLSNLLLERFMSDEGNRKNLKGLEQSLIDGKITHREAWKRLLDG